MSPHTPAQPCQSAPRESLPEEQWVAKTKVTCAKWRPAQCPASHLAQTLGIPLSLPCDRLPPEGLKSFPQIFAPGPGEEPTPRPTIPGLGSFDRAPDAHATRDTHLPRTGLGPILEEAKGRGARAPQKQAVPPPPPPPNPCRVWEKFQAALQRAAGGWLQIHDGAAGRASQAQGGESTAARQQFFLLRRNQTTSGAKASPAPPAVRSRSSPCSAEAAPVTQELLCSGRDRGGA